MTPSGLFTFHFRTDHNCNNKLCVHLVYRTALEIVAQILMFSNICVLLFCLDTQLGSISQPL